MSQAGFTPIQLYYSSTASASPSAGNLASGELALNITDGKLFYKDNGGSVQVLATKAGASGDVVGPASSTDNALVRFDATTGKLVQNSVAVLSDAGALSGLTDISASGSVTLSGGTANGVAYLNGSKVLTTGSALTFNGTFLQLNGAYFANSGAVSNIVAADSTSAFFDTSSSVYPFRWLLGGSEQMRLTSTGLGIGTSSPGAKLDVDGPIRAKGYTVAALPTGVVGARAYVTNALAPVALATVVGGGSAVVPVFFNGTDWIVA
jgi:hypothetical protein